MPQSDYVPQLATLVKAPPSGDEWLHEIKYDGYRIGCRIRRGRVTLLSRNGKDWTAAFPEVVDAGAALGVEDALLDGEVAIVLPDGRTSFQALQNASSGEGARGSLVYFVFDLLRVNGERLERLPLEDRKARLQTLLPRGKARIRYSEHVDGKGDTFFAHACKAGLEGIISKLRREPYRAGRSRDWVKTKCVQRQEFVIGGFTDPEGSRLGIGALLIGYYEGSRLVFSGKVGTGFPHKLALDLRRRLERIEMATCPFEPTPAGSLARHAHWVKPQLVGEVVFTEWTGDGKIRHPSFQGLRADKNPHEVRREQPVAPPTDADRNGPRRNSLAHNSRTAARTAPSDATGTSSQSDAARTSSQSDLARSFMVRGKRGESIVAGVRISHPDRVLYPDPRTTKIDLARYYERIADWIVPHVVGRPLTLVRCPEGLSGDCFFMKHSKVWAPDALRRVQIQEKTKLGDYLIADSIAAVVGLVQMGVLEIHTWNSVVDDVERPNRIVIDLDPGKDVTWTQIVEAGRTVRKALAALDLESFPKTTGGRGLHVVVPLTPHADWSACLDFSRALSEAIERSDPETYTTQFARAGRERKILIDYLRNNRTNTSIAAYSTRARPHAPVSMPITWPELRASLDPASFTIATVPRRLARALTDPWKDYWSCRQKLTIARMRALHL